MKIDETKIDYAEDLDLVMPMYDLQEYKWNYYDTTIAVPLNYLSNFLRPLEMSLLNYKVELKRK